MNRFFFLLLFLSFAGGLFAQDYYSYMTDRRFFDPTDLVGYYFNPDFLEIPDKEVKRELKAGSYSFGIGPGNLYVYGGDIKGLYNVNQINTTDFGFQLLLLDTYNPGKKGHLKVVLNRYGEVEALIFRRSQNEPEMIFFLPILPEQVDERETAYFTDLREAVVPHPDSLYGMSFRPFLRIQNNPRLQQRLQPADSTYISFVEEVEVIEKVKKKGKLKAEEKAEAEEEQEKNEVEIPYEGEYVIDSLLPDSTVLEIKRKIVRHYFVEVHGMVKNEDGTLEKKVWRDEIKKVAEKVDEAAAGMEEKYLIEILTEKGDEYSLFLTAERTFSSFEHRDQVFFARGR